MEKDFLQSEEWRKFQEAIGRKAFNISSDGLWANIIEHKLPIVGKYFYIPHGPILNFKFFRQRRIRLRRTIFNKFSNSNDQISKQIPKLISLAKKENIGWIRFDPENEEVLRIIKNTVGVRFIEPKTGFNKLNPYKIRNYKIIKAPHDMQPREIFVVDITRSGEELLKEMKSKTRYNIKLAEKKNISVKTGKYINEFLRLNKLMSARQGIKTHPDEYYRKMLEIIPNDILKLYVAEYNGEIIAANIIIFYAKTATYLHGASDDKYKNIMVPHLLQWQAIKDAKKMGCEKYDFGGIKTKTLNFKFFRQRRIRLRRTIFNKFSNSNDQISKQIPNTNWAGITRFKLGFSPNTKPVEFPGSYDIIINRKKYFLYKFLQSVKNFLV